jgi:hypothetical protein
MTVQQPRKFPCAFGQLLIVLGDCLVAKAHIVPSDRSGAGARFIGLYPKMGNQFIGIIRQFVHSDKTAWLSPEFH